MGRHWSTKEALERYYRLEGFTLGGGYCLHCGHKSRLALDPKIRRVGLECPGCHRLAMKFTPDPEATP